MKRALAVFGIVTWLGGAAMAQDSPCRQALALGLDVSGSVDAREYRLQLNGLAQALGTETVRRALLQSPHAPVHILVFEWSGPSDQAVLADWTAIQSRADISVLQETLRQVRRRDATPGTSLGPAMRFAAEQLAERAGCWRKTLDISGDGKANAGPRPAEVREDLVAQGITVNALVIGADAPKLGDQRHVEISELSAYFATNVIAGPDAFVQTALGYDAYAEAMARKLERELQGEVISLLRPSGTRSEQNNTHAASLARSDPFQTTRKSQ